MNRIYLDPGQVRWLSAWSRSLMLIAAMCGLADHARAAVFQSKLTASDGDPGDQFGYAVAIVGNRLVIGAPYDDDTATNSGAVYVFERSGSTWTQMAKLKAAVPGSNDYFGSALDVNSDSNPGTIVVGAYADNTTAGTDSGSIYVFQGSGGTWTQVANLTGSVTAASDFFGSSVAITGNRIIVGAPLDDDGGLQSGVAFVFEDTSVSQNWSTYAEDKLIPTDISSGDRFGQSVDIENSTAVIGSYLSDAPVSNSGSAYVFGESAGVWTQTQKLTSLGASSIDQFGRFVAISGNAIAISAPNRTEPGTGPSTGATFVFRKSGSWMQEAKILALDKTMGDEFGHGVSLDESHVISGARTDDVIAGVDAGSAYAHEGNLGTWTQNSKMLAPDGASSDQFGFSTCVDGPTVAIGAPLHNAFAKADAGAVYIFSINFAGALPTATKTATSSPTASATVAASSTATSTPTPSPTASPSASPSMSPSPTATMSATPLATESSTATPSQSPSPSPSPSLSPSPSPSPSVTASPSPSQTPTATQTPTPAPSSTPSPTASETPTPSLTPTSTPTPIPTVSSTPAASPTPTIAVTATATPPPLEGSKLTASDGLAGDQFGYSVAIAGGTFGLNKKSGPVKSELSDPTVVIGAPMHDLPEWNAGAAYVFQYSSGSWYQVAKLQPSDGVTGDQFGFAVSISGSCIAVGSPLDNNEMGTDAGSIYVFQDVGGLGDWSSYTQTKFVASDGAAADQFGASVSIQGSFVIAGSPLDDNAGAVSNSGSAYVFENVSALGDWSSVTQSKLVPMDTEAGDRFGVSVAIASGRAVIGSYLDDVGGSNSGSAYVFHNSGGWVQEAKLVPSDSTALDQFGKSVGIGEDGTLVIIGSPLDDGVGSNSGSSYLFAHSGSWAQVAKLTASDELSGNEFGFAVAATQYGLMALHGAHFEDSSGANAGAAYVSVWNGVAWSQLGKMLAFDGSAGDQFGFSVSVNEGSQAVIGAPWDDAPEADSGSAYIVDLLSF